MATENFNPAFNPDGSVADNLTINGSDDADTLASGYRNDNVNNRSIKANQRLLSVSGHSRQYATEKTINPDGFLGKKTDGFQQPCRKKSADSKSSMGGTQ